MELQACVFLKRWFWCVSLVKNLWAGTCLPWAGTLSSNEAISLFIWWLPLTLRKILPFLFPPVKSINQSINDLYNEIKMGRCSKTANRNHLIFREMHLIACCAYLTQVGFHSHLYAGKESLRITNTLFISKAQQRNQNTSFSSYQMMRRWKRFPTASFDIWRNSPGWGSDFFHVT